MPTRRTLLTLSALVLVVIGGLAILLATLDLNRYREQLADSLSETLGEPVRIGELRVAFLPQPSLDCLDLSIGTPEGDGLRLNAEHLYLKLQLLPLLTGRLAFSEISLRQPMIRLPAGATANAEFNGRLDGWLRSARVQRLRLSEAEIQLSATAGQPPTSLLLDLFLDNLRPRETGYLTLTGALRSTATTSRFGLEGSVHFRDQLSDWRFWQLDLKGQVSQLQPARLLELAGLRPPAVLLERIDQAAIAISGEPTSGLLIELSASGDQLSLSGHQIRDVPLPPLELSTRWTTSAAGQRFDNLTVVAGKTRISGSFSVDHHNRADARLDLQLQLEAPLTDLSRLIPIGRANTLIDPLRRSVRSGQVALQARLELPLSLVSDSDQWLQHLQLEGHLSQASLILGALGEIRRFGLEITQQQGRLRIISAGFDWLGSRFSLAGSVELAGQAPGRLELSLTGEPESAALHALLPQALRDKLELQGRLPSRLTLSGPAGQLSFEFHSDIKYLQGQFADAYLKPAGLAGEIHAGGSLGSDRLQVDNATIIAPPFELNASGSLALTADRPWSAEFALAAIDLQRAQFRSPLLARLQTRGRITARGNLAASEATPLKLEGQLMLHDFGLRITPILADLQQFDGRLLVSESGLTTDQLEGRLGSSPITLEAQLESWRQPKLQLRLQADSIRADELIFRSRQLWLRDLTARLDIDRSGIDFESIRVRLDGGTSAHLQGRMEGYQSPHVRLEINSSYGNIDEIIALWQTDQPRPPRDERSEHGATTTEIAIRAEQGQIGRFRFSDAEALLQTDGLGQLVILPLNFAHDGGYGVGQVLLDSRRPGPPRLEVSGHLENFDAESIYRDLLQRDGLVSGRARGDFHLRGEPGARFLATSSGGVSLRIDDGILLRLPLIAKVFSLLNVAQILSFNAPDMSTEGMPFTNLTGAFALREGVLSTDNLVIHSNSMDMSMVLEQDLKNQTVSGVLAVKPLKTVDSIVSKIPLVGWLLAGEDKAVLTAHFNVRGSTDDPIVTPAPATSIAEPILGIFVRTLQLPGKMVTDLSEALDDDHDDNPQQPPATDATGATTPSDH